MTFSGSSLLLSLTNDTSSFWVRPDASSEHALVTLPAQRKCVKVSLAENTVEKTYFSPTFLALTSPVVFDERSNSYWAVLNGRKIIKWDGQETKLEKVEVRVEVEGKINELVTFEKDTFVIFENGRVQKLVYLLDNPTWSQDTSVLRAGAKLLQTQMVTFQSGLYVIHEVKEKNDPLSVVAFQVMVDQDTDELNFVSEEPAKEIRSRKNNHNLGLVSTWQGHEMLRLNQDWELVLEPLLQKAEERKLFQLKDMNKGAECFAQTIDEDYFCLSYVSLKGKSSKIMVVSTKYLSCTAELDSESIVHDIKPVSVKIDKDRLLLKTTEGLVQVTINDLPRSLGAMIGKTTRQKPKKLESKFGTPALSLYDSIPEMLSSNDVSAVQDVLDSESDIPELLLLNIIEFLVQVSEDKFPKKSRMKNVQVLRENLLQKAFNCSITETLMMQYLGQISFEVAMKMLTFLDLALKLEPGPHTDTFANYIKWCSLLLNAHYSHILLTKDKEPSELLNSLASTVTSFENGVIFYSTMIPLVKLIGDKKYPTRAQYNKGYYIEVVNI